MIEGIVPIYMLYCKPKGYERWVPEPKYSSFTSIKIREKLKQAKESAHGKTVEWTVFRIQDGGVVRIKNINSL